MVERASAAASSRRCDLSLGDEATATFSSMARVVQRVERQVAAFLQRHGLNPGQLDIMLSADVEERLTQQELAARICHTKANVSQLVDKLERAGLVRRIPDGRAYRIALTERGHSTLRAVVPQMRRIIGEALGALSVDERASLREMIGRIEQEGDV